MKVQRKQTNKRPALKSDELRAHTRTMEVLVPSKDDRTLWRKAYEAFNGVFLQVLIFTTIGIALIIVADLRLGGDWKEVLVHLGGAFVVAGIVAFGFEWGREVRHVQTLTALLVNMLWEIKHNVLSAPVRDSVRDGMFILMNKRKSERDLAGQFPQLGAHIGQLASNGGWARNAYIAYLHSSQTQLTIRAAQLAKMTESSPSDFKDSITDVRIDMPDTVVLADVLVEGAMQELLKQSRDKDDAEYLAVSDISTWMKFDRLSKTQKHAAKEITIKRIFVLGLESDRQLPAEKVYEVIADHYCATKNSKYEVRLMMLDQYRSVPLLELAEAKHFGIFKPPADVGLPIAVVARDDGISKLRVTTAPDAMLREFEALWCRAEKLQLDAQSNTQSQDLRRHGDVIDDFLMAYFVRRMPRDGHYRGISHFSKWLAGSYKIFFKASQDSFLRKGVRAQRIFILDDDWKSDTERMIELLSQHESLRKKTDSRYQWRLCKSEDVKGEIAKEVPVGFFDSASDEDPLKVIIDRAQPTRRWAQTTSEENHLLSMSFDNLWKKCGEPRHFLKDLSWVEAIFDPE
jgi:hypothetical protein